MKLSIPLIKAQNNVDCGPIALQMVLKYFGKNHSLLKISKLMGQLSTGMTWTLGITKVAALFGFNIQLYATENSSHEGIDKEYYAKYAGKEENTILNALKREIINMKNIEWKKKKISLSRMLNKISKNSIGIVLLNWKIILGKKAFQGHFVPITGYDKDYIYVNNSGPSNPEKDLPIKKEIFKKAWESEGTDQDVLFIRRKFTKSI